MEDIMGDELRINTKNNELNVDDLLKQLDQKINTLFVKHKNEVVCPRCVKGFLLDSKHKHEVILELERENKFICPRCEKEFILELADKSVI